MDWQIVLLLNASLYTTAVIFIKLVSSKLPRSRAMALQFLLCVFFVILFRTITGKPLIPSLACFAVLGLGIYNCFGVWCQWRAIKINLAKTSLFDPLSEVLAMVLAIIFLSETETWNTALVIGIALTLFAAYLFIIKKQNQQEKKISMEWLLCTLCMITVFGTKDFTMKIFADNLAMPRSQYLMFHYAGSFLGAIVLLSIDRTKPDDYSKKSRKL